jgi:glycosyltransferase involved in cell wall biosynthesis
LATIWQPSERRSSISGAQPRIFFVNQTVNSPFCAWLETLAGEYGTVALLSGNAPADWDLEVIVYRGPAYDRSSVRSRLWTWVRFTAWATWVLLWSDRRTPVFVVTNPPLMPLAVWLLHAVQGRRFGLLEWDIYPQVLQATGLLGSRHIVVRWWRSLHGRALRAAGLVITIGERMAMVLHKMAEVPGLEIAVVPNWVDTDRIQPMDQEDNDFVRAQGLREGLVVLYSGNLGATHAVETIVQVAEELSETEGIIFLVVGEGAKREIVEEAISAGKVPNLRLLHRQPASTFPQVLASAQIGIVTLADGLEELSMPSKTYDLMAAGTAILGISRAPNDLAMTIERHRCGVNFSPDSIAAIAEWLRKMAADADGLDRMRCASRQAAVEYYSTAAGPLTLTELVRERLLS